MKNCAVKIIHAIKGEKMRIALRVEKKRGRERERERERGRERERELKHGVYIEIIID